MSVKLIDNSAFYGFRVRRTIAGKVYQEYFSLKSEGTRLELAAADKIRQQADARDLELAEMQRSAKSEKLADRCFRGDGSVRGLSYLLKAEKNGNQTPIFQLGIASELSGSILCTSVSISAYGEDDAWRRVINKYAEHKKIEKTSALYKRLIVSKDKVIERKLGTSKAA